MKRPLSSRLFKCIKLVQPNKVILPTAVQPYSHGTKNRPIKIICETKILLETGSNENGMQFFLLKYTEEKSCSTMITDAFNAILIIEPSDKFCNFFLPFSPPVN